MRYNFDEFVDRKNTNAMKLEGYREYIFHAGPEMQFPYADDEFIHMWVADMEFATADVIRDAMKARIERKIFGYTLVYDKGYFEAFNNWCSKMYGVTFPTEQIVFAPGIIPALYQIVESVVKKDEKIMTLTPAYGFFQHAAEYNGIELVKAPLTYKGNGDFEIDFDDFEKKASDPKVKLLMWCNPHNPTGRVWKKEELEKVAEIVKKYDLWIVSDEIHCDLLRQGVKHIPMAKIMTDYNKLITCMSASKTFNMAGLMFSNIIIRNDELRKEFVDRDKLIAMVNPLSVEAHKAAYEKGYEWLDELKTYLDGNFKLVKDYFAENLPKAECYIPESTYLSWVYLGDALPGIDDICKFFADNSGVLLEGGDDLFVGNAKGWVRLNLAMPRAKLEEGLKRMVDAVNKHYGK